MNLCKGAVVLKEKSVLVIGGGVSGIQASLDLANRGLRVYLVDKTPSIGGKMAQLDKTFPTMDCSICILAPKMIECLRHPNITLLTYSVVEDIRGSAGNFEVVIRRLARCVDEKCTGCGICAEICPVRVSNEFDCRLGARSAIYVPYPQAVPLIYTVDKEHCIRCGLCEMSCDPDAIDLDMLDRKMRINVGSIIASTGYDIFDPSSLKEYGFGLYPNVITSLQFERLANASGPTVGKIIRPSDGKPAKRIAFIQCVGSRSQKTGYDYCSSACCMYATKEAILIKEHEPESEVYIFYVDLKVFGKGFQEFVNRAKENWGVRYISRRPGEIEEEPRTGDLILRYEDPTNMTVEEMVADLVVLCPAFVSKPSNKKIAEILGVETDEYGFFKARDPPYASVDTNVLGVFVCGCCQGPKDIPESVAQASGAAERAAEVIALTAAKGGHKRNGRVQ